MYILLAIIILLMIISLNRHTSLGDFSFDLICSSQAKGLAIILVILGHLNTEMNNWRFMRCFGSIGVAIFLFISGYGLVKSYKKSGLKQFWEKRLNTVWIPYFIITLIWLCIDFFLNKKHNIIISLLALLGMDFTRTIDPTMWYITFIFYWYLAFYLIWKFIKKDMFRLITAIMFSVLSIMIWYFKIVGGASYQWGVHAFIFPIGIFYALYGEKLFKKYNYKIIIPFAVLGVILNAYIYNFHGTSGIYFMLMDIVSLIFIVCILLLINKRGIIIGFLDIIGRYSYEIYLVEGYLISKIIYPIKNISMELSLVVYFFVIILSTIQLRKIILVFGKLRTL